jgi:glycosyltransferase involved in cell wall biosynthesis
MTMALTNRRVLYISYNGMLEPLGQSQVIPYLRELSKLGVRFTLLSFERDAAFTPDGAVLREELRRQLSSEGIEWHYLRYHRTPSLPATIYDVVNGVRYARKVVLRNRIEMVHARSHIAATIAMALKKRSPLKMIFDVRGLMAEEYVDANHWREGGIPYRLTKTMERRALQAADGVVTLTEKVWPVIKDWEGLRDREVIHEVVPCCADLELFCFSEDGRLQAKERLNLRDRFVLVYSGSVGGWYLADKMADFFVELTRMRPNSHFLWLTGGPKSLIQNLMSERGLNADQFTVCAARPLDVPMFLSAADVGIAFYKPALSRLATSPVKLAEYLACGLPVVINAGVGDSDTLISTEGVGAVVRRFDETEYREVLSTIVAMLGVEARQRSRKVAEQFFDVRRVGVERYARLYEELLDRAN